MTPYNLEELIHELKSDLNEFGTCSLVDVKLSNIDGDMVPVDYNLHFDLDDSDLDDEDLNELKETEMKLNDGEKIEVMEIVDALLLFSCHSDILGGSDYLRELIEEYSAYVKMSPLLSDLGIDRVNYTRFMAGDDTKLSKEKAALLFKSLLTRPIFYNFKM